MASDEVLTLIEEAACSQELDLSWQGLTEIPREVFQLKNLTWLNLSHNQIVKIPDEIAQLQTLITLHLGSNQIVKYPMQSLNYKL